MEYLLAAGFFDKLGDILRRTLIVDNRWLLYLKGLGYTIGISLGAIAIGIVLGVIMAIFRYLDKKCGICKIPSKISGFIIAVLRGTPVVVQLMIMAFVVLASFMRFADGIIVAIITFGINSSAYVAELMRGGLESIDDGQMEAGKSLGFGIGKIMILIILPQAFRKALPPMGNEFIALIKETSVAGYVGIMDLTKVANLIIGRVYEAFIPLIISALIYLLLVMALTWILRRFERRLAKSDRT